MCFGLYTLFADRVGKTGAGLDGLALSVTVAALDTSPVSIGHAPHASAAQWGVIAALILRQTITVMAVLGIIVVSFAGALLVWSSGGDAVNG